MTTGQNDRLIHLAEIGGIIALIVALAGIIAFAVFFRSLWKAMLHDKEQQRQMRARFRRDQERWGKRMKGEGEHGEVS